MESAPDAPDLGGVAIRAAAADENVDGVAPRWVAYPTSPEEVAEVVGYASGRGWSVVARGSGTKMSWGAPPVRTEVIVDLSKMDAVVEHSTGDFVARVQPGATLAGLGSRFARSRQRIPIDEVVPGSTVGGVIATGLSGPSRYRYGPVRDQLIGVQFVRGDGTLVRSGSKVVKNVAGYDLAKLLTGSYGTLGIVTEAILRLRPMAEDSRYVTVRLDRESDAAGLLAGLRRLPITPTAIEIESVPSAAGCAVTVLFEGSPALVDAGAEAVGRVGNTVGDKVGDKVIVSESPTREWASLPGTTTVKLAVEIGSVAAALEAVRSLAGDDLAPTVRGSAGTGVLYVGIAGESPPELVAGFIERLRMRSTALGGSAVALRAPRPVKELVDVWGQVAGLELMRRVKDAFDPGRVFAPGRFVGGI